MLIAALLTISKTWKQPKCPSTEEEMKMRYTYTMEYYSVVQRDEITPFTETWTQLEIIILTEVRKTNTI